MNHAYVYWQIIKDDFKEQNIVPENYHNRLHKWSDKIYSKISKNIQNPSFNESKQICYNLIYTLTRYERNAFLSEIVSYLYDNKEIFKNIESVKETLKKSTQYNLYISEDLVVIGIIKEKWSSDKKQLLADAYNEICNKRYASNKIIKLLEFKLEETIKKINANIVKLCEQHKNNDEETKENSLQNYETNIVSYIDNCYQIEWF